MIPFIGNDERDGFGVLLLLLEVWVLDILSDQHFGQQALSFFFVFRRHGI